MLCVKVKVVAVSNEAASSAGVWMSKGVAPLNPIGKMQAAHSE
jgi:hypothetical protein